MLHLSLGAYLDVLLHDSDSGGDDGLGHIAFQGSQLGQLVVHTDADGGG